MNIISNCGRQVIKLPLIPPLFSLAKACYGYIRSFQKKLIFDAWSISNRNHVDETDEYIKVLFIGKNNINKNYLCRLFFKRNVETIYLGKLGILRVFIYLWGFQKNYDFIIVNSRMNLCNLFKSSTKFLIPEWITCEIDLSNEIGSRSKSKRTLKTNIRKIKRGNFTYSITKDIAAFDFFYYYMHLPYISKRHGDSAFKMSYLDIRKSFENGELLQIKEKGKIVAGVIIDYKIMHDMPRITKLGVLNGDFNYVKRGALSALYYYTIRYLKEKKYKKLSLGSTRPFLSDGVLQHKLNWGAKIVCETSNAFLLSLVSKKKCLKKFLLNNPFILKNRNNLSLAIFSDQNIKACPYLSKNENKIKLYGLDKLTSFSL
jgi:hypothetical protein